VCRPAATGEQHLAAPRLLLQEAEPSPAEVQRIRLRTAEALKHFCHMLEARHFTIFTDHKPITYAFQQKRDKFSPWQFNHLDFVSQFTTDIQHISG
jgi:cleavage and polyadenylation specificity factor subunit 1